ncbi:alpha-hydroxy-acid oxidizing protein [Allopusillimonas ginsengisoli]|uniref:alpha-hydroxy acid oxidase n=1 Tax=Allopusillimonas ginsengisoli TaxID=453575 RepID=UPI0039C28357
MAIFRTQSRRLDHILSLDDFETAARKFLPRPIFGYIAGAAEDNTSLHQNRTSFQDYSFIPSVLVDVSTRSSAVNLFDQTYDSPFGIAPFGLSALAAYRGDIVLAKSAETANIPMIMSGSSLIRLEEVADVSPNAWFQAYLPGETKQISELLARVRSAGFKTLVVTVDTPVAANRENNIRTGFSTPLRPSFKLAWEGVSHPSWLLGTFLRTVLKHGIPHFENNYATRGAPIISSDVMRDFSDRAHFTWEHLSMIRRVWPERLVVKGILSASDAAKACSVGVDGIIVSNHGGRQLDGAVAPIRVLPAIVEMSKDVPVMLDGGIRRGTDVLKAIALGAKMTFLARPFAYAGAVAGGAGVDYAIKLFCEEISRNMAMLGVTSIRQVDIGKITQTRL